MRVERGLSLGHVADAVELSKGHLSSIERGLVNITVGTLERIARALNTTSMHVMCGLGDSPLEAVVEEVHALPWDAKRELIAKVAAGPARV
jgi:transcriptional regulator with XRE-family HTH domain